QFPGDDHAQTVQRPPDHEVPVRSVPDAGNEKGDEQIPAGVKGPATVPAEGNIDVVAEPGGQADVPARPEFAQAGGEVGIVEVQDEMEAHQLRHAASHVRVAAEVEKDLPPEGDGCEHQRRRAERLRIFIDPLDVERKEVGQRQFLEQPDQKERRAVGEVLQPDLGEFIELRQQMPGALDRPGHELGKETNEGRETEKVPFAMDVAEIEVDRVAQRLEGEERDADGEQVFEAERHQRGRIGQFGRYMEPGEEVVDVFNGEAGVFEKQEQRKIVDQADQEPDPAAA